CRSTFDRRFNCGCLFKCCCTFDCGR
ncbi:hypothetical protein D030_0751B, partial [Vibrio parahaemolyticus AQ3810]